MDKPRMEAARSAARQALGRPAATTEDDGEAALIAREVYLDPRNPNPAEARLVESGVHVWALVAYRDANIAGLAEIAEAYQVSPEAVKAAFAFYRRHRCAIDGRIALNE